MSNFNSIIMNPQDQITVELKYTCGGNYKSFLDVKIPMDSIPNLEVGQVRPIEDFSMSPSEMYLEIGNVYDSDLDHNLVEVLNIQLPEQSDQQD